jgi:hypothetical protein
MDMKRTTMISRMKKLGIEPRTVLSPSIKRSFVPPTGSFCFLELSTLELPPVSNRRQVSRDRRRDFPTPSRSRSISSVKVSDLRDVLAALRFGPSIAFTYLQSM